MPQQNLITLKVPNIGEAEFIELISWNIESGDKVDAGQELCELATDKAAFPLEAPASGQVVEILKNAKAQVKVGDALLTLKVH